MVIDVPSPIDLRRMDHAKEWADAAMVKQPWRTSFFAALIDAMSSRSIREIPCGVSAETSSVNAHDDLQVRGHAPVRILELGSGPGFLTQALLQAFTSSQYVALDFSAAMHALAKERLGDESARVDFLLRNFKEPDWTHDLPIFDCVVTQQAVHELRHKTHALELHLQVRQLLHEQGHYYVCDHYAGGDGMENTQLYMTVSEQKAALHAAGFNQVKVLLEWQGLVLHQASL